MNRVKILADLLANVCVCGQPKRTKMSLCRRCYAALPGNLQRDLYKRFGEGYEGAYEKSVAHLAALKEAAR